MNNNSNYLKSPDLLPLGHAERKISGFGFAVIWIGMAIVLAAFAIGGGGIQSLTLGWVIVATIIGSILIGILMVLLGDIGIEHGVSFPVYMRAPFGTIGTHFPSVVRAITASCWFGINTYFGSSAINGILNLLFGFDNWVLCYFFFAAAQLINTALGIKSIERFADFAAPIIILISCWMYIHLADEAALQGKNVWAWAQAPAVGFEVFSAFMVVTMAIMGFWATLALDMPTLCRFLKAPKYERNWFKRNKSQFLGSLVMQPLFNTLMVMIGAVSFIALSNFDPVFALQETAGGFLLGVLLLMIVLAQWSTNTTANVVPAATVFSNVGGPKVPFWVGVIIAGVIGTLAQPWNIFDVLNQALLVIGGILTSVVGILFVDYYVLRKRRLNVIELYEIKGQFQYTKGINWAGIIAWIVGGVIANLVPTFSSLVGFFVGGILYYFLAKYWWFKKYEQKEIVDPDDEKYLGLTVGRDWVIQTDGDIQVASGGQHLPQ